MIAKTVAYKVSDGTVVGSLEEAQVHEMGLLLEGYKDVDQRHPSALTLRQYLVAQGPRLLDILTTKPTSRPARRKVNGAEPLRRNKRKDTLGQKMDQAVAGLMVESNAKLKVLEEAHGLVTPAEAKPHFDKMRAAVDTAV